MSLHVYLLCHNEEVLLPHAIEHYRRRVPSATFTILDNESDDRSVEIARELGCAVRTWSTGGKIDDVMMRDLKNDVWREVPEGWVIVADMDEWLCVTEADLAHEERSGTTILRTYGWNVFGDSASPTLDEIDLHALNTGNPHPPESKEVCFRRPQITAINYEFGAHVSAPEGAVRWSRKTYPLKHIAWPGHAFMIHKHQLRYARGKEQQVRGLGMHYTDDAAKVSAGFAGARSAARTFSEAPFRITPERLLVRVVKRLRRTARKLIRAARRTNVKTLVKTLVKTRAEAKRFYNFYVSKNALSYTVERTATVEGSAGVAIVVLYPRGPLLESVTRLISTLVAEQYLVIAVVNKSSQSPEWLAALTQLNITLLSRPNVGRDFGAYRVGYLFAERQGLLKNARHLIFANDSIYYGPRSQAHIVELLKDEHPWTAMFVNYELHTHAQSFFLRFSNELFSLPGFHQFWRDFYPSEKRMHNINQGEVKLTSTLITLGYTPHGFISADRILSSSLFGDFTEYEKQNILRFCSAAELSQVPIERQAERQAIEALMRSQFFTKNITHAQGTLAARVLGAPLKLDLAARQLATPEVLHETLVALGCSAEEATTTLAFMLKPSKKRLARTTQAAATQVPHEQPVAERPSLHALMSVLHRTLKPRTYLEVGVFMGDSLKLARRAAVGIDPAPQVTQRLPVTAHVVTTTGDDFFAQPRPLEQVFKHGGVPTAALTQSPRLLPRWLKGAPRRRDGELFAELALIDGMHHAEFALRDFINIERNSAPWSVIVFDDTLPENHEQALRARATEAWTGDVFRVEEVLKRYRPDLITVRVDTYTGALLVFAPDHLNRRLTNFYDQIVAEAVQSDPQVVPDEVLQRNGAIPIETLIESGVLEVLRTARERGFSSDWVARNVRKRLIGQ